MIRFVLGCMLGGFLLWAFLILTETPPKPLNEILKMTIECWECKKEISYREYGEFGGVCKECAEYFQSLRQKTRDE